jgi:hypothetical protein
MCPFHYFEGKQRISREAIADNYSTSIASTVEAHIRVAEQEAEKSPGSHVSIEVVAWRKKARPVTHVYSVIYVPDGGA